MIKITNPNEGVNGNTKENIFYALSEEDQFLGYSYVYPSYNENVTPLDPYSIYLDVDAENDDVKVELFKAAFKRAKELRDLKKDVRARIYGGCLIDQKEKLAFYESVGFIPDDGTYLYECDLTGPLKEFDDPRIVEEKMDLDEIKEQYIAIHNRIFVRPIDIDALNEMKKEKLFTNFTIFDSKKIIGNIMVYVKDGIGYIENLFVLKEARKQGLGKALLSRALHYFKTNGITCVQLEVWGRNAYALEMYKSFGFQFVCEKELYPGINL